jgi:transcriptional regulator with XRE-family HTH domain
VNEEEKKMAKEFGTRLHILRVKRDISQIDLAKKLKCTQAFVSEWQSGKKLISTKYLARICKILNVPWDFFNPENNNYLDYLKS